MTEDNSSRKAELQDLLRTYAATITFIKKDGTERVMRCTLRPDLIEPYRRVSNQVRKPNDKILSVWSVDDSGWRAISLDTIQIVEVILGIEEAA